MQNSVIWTLNSLLHVGGAEYWKIGEGCERRKLLWSSANVQIH